MDYSLPGSSVHRVFQAQILEWVAISYSRASSQPRDQTRVSCISYTGRQILYHLIVLLLNLFLNVLFLGYCYEWIVVLILLLDCSLLIFRAQQIPFIFMPTRKIYVIVESWLI